MLHEITLENPASEAHAAQVWELKNKVRDHEAELESTLVELRASQQQLVQKERLSALGAMVTGVAHDFSNSLALILSAGEMLQRKSAIADPTGSLDGYSQTIVTAALDAAQRVQRLQEFHRPTEAGELRPGLSLRELAQQALEFTRPRWEAESSARGLPIEAYVEAEDTGLIAGNTAEIRELITNLIFNSIDALPQGGMITIRIRRTEEKILLEVEDTGTGMSQEVQRRCLEPFFTTKGERGSGLGLATVYGILERHGGAVMIESELGVGTRFVFEFTADLSGAASADASSPKAQQPLRILVVDDQPFLGELLAESLTRDWHTVETAPNGRVALEKFEEAEFDLVITDKAMPEMNGDQLAAAVKARNPSVRVLMLTGFGVESAEEHTSEFIDYVLPKPASAIQLRAAIEALMAPPPAPQTDS